jgi:hypothetical protein
MDQPGGYARAGARESAGAGTGDAGGPGGAAVRSAELCWGQRYHWLRYQSVPPAARHDAHIVVNCALPEGLSLPALRSALDYLVRRHEGLRTVVDPAGRSGPRQVVQPPRPLPLHTATTEADGTPAPAEVIAGLSRTPFDLERDWPIRVCAVTTAGAPRRLAVVLHHMTFDDWGLALFQREFGALLDALGSRRRAQLPPVAQQPADLAAAETAMAPPDRAAALRHWEQTVPLLPTDPFARRRRAPRPDPGQAGPEPQAAARGPVAHTATLTSPGMLAAVRDIAARLKVWPSAVHLAAYATGMAAYTGEAVVAHRWLASHREGSRMDVLSCMFSPALVRVDLSGDPGFGEVAARVARALRTAQRHAYAPWDEVAELVAAEGHRRGRPLRVTSEANFLTSPAQHCGSRRDRLVRGAEPYDWALSATDTYLRVRELADGVSVGLNALDEVMDADAVEAFLHGYARVIAAHADPAADLRFSDAAALFGFPPPGGPAASGPAVNGLAAIDTAPIGPHVARAAARDDRGGPARAALLRAVAEANALDAVEPGLPYVPAGGRLLRAPYALALLRDLGWAGVALPDLAGVRPHAELADALVPAEPAQDPARHGSAAADAGPAPVRVTQPA